MYGVNIEPSKTLILQILHWEEVLLNYHKISDGLVKLGSHTNTMEYRISQKAKILRSRDNLCVANGFFKITNTQIGYIEPIKKQLNGK